MATYKQIRIYVKEQYDLTNKDYWIADMKEQCRLNPSKAPNCYDDNVRTNLCPERHKDKILKAFINLGMVRQ
ncbi:hypothetical protein [Haloplasma contractile]|uniref:RNA methyltransferase protein n=1 Tax=Haloplasma contractile SSD-17B TaxID=1033810 RepID=F7PTW3_9MOLU|nr:hypothetical protein [Haloplasma contractile]ERJ12281.1 RNA methyltransferase protein [Haloplasma contractile SSD-17B]